MPTGSHRRAKRRSRVPSTARSSMVNASLSAMYTFMPRATALVKGPNSTGLTSSSSVPRRSVTYSAPGTVSTVSTVRSAGSSRR
ncbi:MAG: hypothetical protein GWN02_14645 [Gemmatimonadetes bacterium]|nr:hypothetical protein [Gemmatimonadota bacterium]